MLFDAFGFQLPPGPAGYLRLAGRTILFDQLIALPIGLVLSSVGPRFLTSYLVASVYAQSIGILCAVSSRVALPRLDGLSPARTVGGVVALYFACGVIGAEVARHMCAWLLPAIFDPRPAFISWAIGATVALLVGIGLTTVRTLRARVLSRELEALQARINPHFLFNTLNSIAALIRTRDNNAALTMLVGLSELMRSTLDRPAGQLLPLGEEVNLVKRYVDIQRARFGDRLDVSYRIDSACEEVDVPAFLLQPIVENALRHGLAERGPCHVEIGASAHDGSAVRLWVTDDGSGLPPGFDLRRHAGTGLSNASARIKRLYGSAASLTLRANAPTGTVVELILPRREASPAPV